MSDSKGLEFTIRLWITGLKTISVSTNSASGEHGAGASPGPHLPDAASTDCSCCCRSPCWGSCAWRCHGGRHHHSSRAVRPSHARPPPTAFHIFAAAVRSMLLRVLFQRCCNHAAVPSLREIHSCRKCAFLAIKRQPEFAVTRIHTDHIPDISPTNGCLPLRSPSEHRLSASWRRWRSLCMESRSYSSPAPLSTNEHNFRKQPRISTQIRDGNGF